MSAAPLAALAAVLGVLALWDALAAAEQVMRGGAAGRLLAPLVRARRFGTAPSVAERRRLATVAALALLAAGLLIAGPVAGCAAGLAGPWALRAHLRGRRRRWRAELERAAPAVARAAADALAAGHAIPRALAEAGRSVDGAAAAEVRALADALAVGQPLEDALAALRARADSRAYDTLATAILLQRDAGGDLAGLLRELARAH
ncbi:MAG TPA: type II secretion system F family protein, partial [Conexibacter sp.]